MLSLPLGALEDITPYELSWLLEAHYKKEREWFELLNHTIIASIASANSGKKIPLFKEGSGVKQKEHKNKKVFSSIEEKRAEFSKMKEQFK